MSQPSLAVQGPPDNEATVEPGVKYLDALEMFSKGDLDRVRQIIPGWMAEYNQVLEDGSTGAASAHVDPLIASCTPLHLAVQCPRKDVISTILDFDSPKVPIDAPDQQGQTALHLAAKASRKDVVRMLLRHGADDMLLDTQGQDPLACATEPDVAAVIQDHRSELVHATTARLFDLVRNPDTAPEAINDLLDDPAQASRINLAARDKATDGTILHLAVQHGNLDLARWAITQGVDVFARDASGRMAEKYAQDNAHMRELLTQAPMGSTRTALSGKAPQFSGELNKWTNYMGGWKSRWFELSQGTLYYYKSKADADASCRGAINLRIAKIMMVGSGRDKTQFEVHGKGSNKYRLKAADQSMAKQWVHLLNVSKQWALENHKTSQQQAGGDNESTADSASLQQATRDRATSGASSSGFLKPPATTNVPVSADAQSQKSLSNKQQHTRGASTSSFVAEQSAPPATTRRRASSSSPHAAGSRPSSGDPLASPATSVMSNDSDDELYISRDRFLALISDLRSQLFVQERLLAALQQDNTRESSAYTKGGENDLLKSLAIASQSVTQTRALVDALEKSYRDTSAIWQGKLRREQERIDLLAENLRSAVVSSQSMLETMRQKARQQPTAPGGAVAGASSSEEDAGLEMRRNMQNADSAQSATAASGDQAIPSIVSGDGASSTVVPVAGDDSSEMSEDDSDFADATDEFFDTAASVVSLNNSGLRASPSSTTFKREATVSEAEETATPPAPSSAEVSPDQRDLTALSGYVDPVDIRTTLPEITKGGPSLNLWSVISGAIGKDLSKISVPVFFNEPTSFLQRFTEDMEYCDLLEFATLMPRSEDRTLFVAGFAMSNYASTFGRIAKPFNPLLGETYEYVRRDKKYRALSEQVEHHPPISACWVEGKNYVYHADTNIKSKFNGGSLTVVPTGVCHVELKLPLAFLERDEELQAGEPRQKPSRVNREAGYFVEHYTWNKLTTNVNGIIIANFWIEHVGDLDVRNHRTGDVTKITFQQSNWMGKNKFKVTGEARNRRGQVVHEIAGDWTAKLVARPTGTKSGAASAEDAIISAPANMDDSKTATDAVQYAVANTLQVPRKPFVLWKINPRPEGATNTYHLTTYAMSLNYRPPELQPFLCPTDSRFRPDQRAMETGEYELADTEKSRLENKQRATRRRREQGELPPWKPRWFVKAFDEDSQEEYWRFTDEYWIEREKAAEKQIQAMKSSPTNEPVSGLDTWTNVEDIF
ncbi:hypothetical protein GGI07_004974 [Coemansia sp. Benny D115]|nr:hypothetical protein GGI07_004974 [Coemansia sp. Benny D115]